MHLTRLTRLTPQIPLCSVSGAYPVSRKSSILSDIGSLVLIQSVVTVGLISLMADVKEVEDDAVDLDHDILDFQILVGHFVPCCLRSS